MKKIFWLVATVAVFAACSKGSIEQGQGEGPAQKITVNVASFDEDALTKTAVTTGGAFTWSAGDQIGIYPLSVDPGQVSQQIIFKVEGGADAASSTFTGTGWGLVTNGSYSYFSYYPYSASTTLDEAVVTYSTILNQEDNSSTAHLSGSDYLYAPAITPVNPESASLDFYHIGAFVEFQIAVPEAVKTKSFKKVVVSAEEDLFTVSAKYNPSTTVVRNPGAGQYGPTLTEKTLTNELVLTLNNTTGFTPDASGKIHAYFLIAPAAVSGKTLTVKIVDTDNIAYSVNKTPSSNIESQSHPIYLCNVTETPLSVATNLSETGTANCYIVPEYGRYKFLANVKGNGYDPLDEVNHNASAAIDLTGCTPVVLWETVNTGLAPSVGSVVSDLDIEGNYILFTGYAISGNAVIALKNSSDEIVWSWHIWSVDGVDLAAKAQNYNGATMMDRNLGALSATPGDALTVGFLYQWGRPWPIRGALNFTNTQFATTNSSGLFPEGLWEKYKTTSEIGTLTYSAAHPTYTLYRNSANKFSDGETASDNWLWAAAWTENPALWGATKTMYDPCPVGWKIPHSSVWADFNGTTFPLTVNGHTYGSDVYYPAAGYLHWDNGNLSSTGTNGLYFRYSLSPSTTNCGGLMFYGATVSSLDYALTTGRSIRPCQE